MATIGTTYPSTSTDTLDGTSSSSSSTSTSSTSSSSTDSLANESTFLNLLVAQLKNQDPAQPADGTQFVTQLAQFSDLEQNLAMRTDLDALSTKYAGTSSTSTTTSTTDTTSVSN